MKIGSFQSIKKNLQKNLKECHCTNLKKKNLEECHFTFDSAGGGGFGRVIVLVHPRMPLTHEHDCSCGHLTHTKDLSPKYLGVHPIKDGFISSYLNLWERSLKVLRTCSLFTQPAASAQQPSFFDTLHRSSFKNEKQITKIGLIQK